MIELTLPTMTCNHCVRAVTEAVHRIDAQASLQFVLAEHKVKIESQQPAEAFRAVLTEEGYAPA